MKKILALLFTLALAAGVADAAVVFKLDTYVGLSSDTKPAYASDLSRFYESDTKRHFLKVSGTWTEITPQTHGTADHTGFIGDEDQVNFASTGGHKHNGIDATPVPHALTASSTGVLSGCLVTKNADPVYFDMTECTVRFIDNTTAPLNPTISTVTVSAQTHVTVTNLVTWSGTYLGINSSGSIVQQETAFTHEQDRTIVSIAFLFHANGLNIKSVLTHAMAAFDPAARFSDAMHSVGIMNLGGGNQYTANGANLKVNKSAGSSYALGANFQVNAKDPDTTIDPSITPMGVTPRSYRDGSGGWTQSSYDVLNPNNYDDGTGTLPAVPAGNWIAIPLYYIPGLGTDGPRVQYPQRYFATKAEAIAAIPDPLFIRNPNLINGTIRTYCVVQQGTTALNDPALAEFVQMGKFEDTIGGAGAGGGGAPTDGEYVTYSANPLLSSERVLSNGTNTTIDTGTAGQIKVNLSGTHADSFHSDSYSGIGGCTNQFTRTLNDTAAPTCATVGVADVAAGGTTPDNTKYWRGDGTWQVVTGGSGYSTIQNEGTPLTQRTTLNFVGTGVDCADDTTRTSCTINTGGVDLSGSSFWTKVAEANLSNEIALGTLGSGLILNTTTTGVPTIYGGTSCTNQFTRSLNTSGAATCAGVGVNDFTANQGATTTLLHGNGAGQPSWGGVNLVNDAVANQGATNTLIHGNAAGQPSWGFVNLVNDVTGTLAVTKGGSGLATVAADQVRVGTAADTLSNVTLPACANGTTSKLLYDTATHAFSCGTDQTAGGGPTTAKLTADYTNTSVTGTNVAGLNVTLGAGTWRFSYILVSQTAAVGTGIDYGVTFTGTQTLLAADLSYADSGTAATTGIADGTVTGDGGELLFGRGSTLTASTTTPNLNVITGVVTANENFIARVEGVIIVTVSGTLQLWASTDVAASQVTIKAGSSLLAFSH